jgi:hypothetical protein
LPNKDGIEDFFRVDELLPGIGPVVILLFDLTNLDGEDLESSFFFVI